MVNHKIITILILTLISITIAQFDKDAIIFPDQLYGAPELSESRYEKPSANYKSAPPVYQHAPGVLIYDIENPSDTQTAYDVQPPRHQHQPMNPGWYPSSQGAQANANAQAADNGLSQAGASSQASGSSSQGYDGSVTSSAHASSQSSGRFYCPPYCSLLSASSAASATSGIVNGVPVAASSASAAAANARDNSGTAASASSTAMGKRWIRSLKKITKL